LAQFKADLIASASATENDIRLANAAQSAKDLTTTLQAAEKGIIAQRKAADK